MFTHKTMANALVVFSAELSRQPDSAGHAQGTRFDAGR